MSTAKTIAARTEPPLSVWLLSDDAPGHLSQSRGIVDALATPGMKDVLAGMSAEPGGMPPAEFDRYVRAEVQRWTGLVQNTPSIKE